MTALRPRSHRRIARDLLDDAQPSPYPSSSIASLHTTTSRPGSVIGVMASPGVNAAQVDPNTQIIDATTTARAPTAAVAPPVAQTLSSNDATVPLDSSPSSDPAPDPTTSLGPTVTAAAADPALTSLITAGPAWSTPTPTPTPTSSGSKGLGFPVIVGIGVGGAVAVIALLSCCWLASRRRKKKAVDDLPSHSKSRARRRSRILSRARPSPQQGGYARHDAYTNPHLPPRSPRGAHLTPPGPALSRAEARASVQMSPSNFNYSQEVLQPPSRSYLAGGGGGGGFDDAATTTTAWTDNSEMDVFAVDGSSYARTLSTVSRPNSEYDLEDDPGATYTGPYSTGRLSPFTLPTMASSAAQLAAQQRAQQIARELHSPSPGGYPPPAPSPAGMFGAPAGPVPGRVAAWREASGGMVSPPRVSPTAPPPSQTTQTLSDAGPSRQRIPAPRLLVDTKAPLGDIQAPPLSAPLSAMPSALSTLNSTWTSLNSTPLSAYPPTNWSRNPTPEPARGLSPETRRAMSPEFRAALSPETTRAPSRADGRPLVTRQGSRGAEDRPSALPYARDSRPPRERDRVVRHDTRPGLTRGPTIIRHADAGAFEDVVPDDADEVHLPPAYDEIYSS